MKYMFQVMVALTYSDKDMFLSKNVIFYTKNGLKM